MRVRVDPDLCQGHTLCARRAPGAFDLDEVDGHATARHDVVPEDMVDAVRAAVATCPERAISVLPD
jgi:ferredoxin